METVGGGIASQKEKSDVPQGIREVYRMKSISVKRIAAVAAGAAMIGAAFAGAVTPEGLGNYAFFSNGEPQVKIVVGSKAAASDGVAAANIAAMIGNLAYTSKTIDVLGKDKLSCAGGTTGSCAVSEDGKKASLEITTPGVNPAVAYEMKTYIESYLKYNSLQDDSSARTPCNAPTFPTDALGGKTGGTDYCAKRVTNSETPILFSGYVNDNTASKKYKEEERLYFYTQATWVNADKKVEATPPQIAYHIQFVDPIPYCTNLKNTTGTPYCEDSDLTKNHHVKINFLGDPNWTIVDMSNINSSNAIVTLGKEITTNGLMQVGDVVTDPTSNYSVKLVSVSPFSTTTAQVRDAQFQAFDGSGNLVGTYRIVEGGTDTVAGPNIVIKVNKLFSGTGGVANADVTLFSQKLELKTSGNIDTQENKYWQMNIQFANSGMASNYNDALSQIRLTRSVSTDYLKNAGDYMSVIEKPQAFKFTYNGLTQVDYEPLTFSIFTSPISVPSNSADNTTITNGIQISAARNDAFTVSGTNVNTVYLSTIPESNYGLKLFYLKSNGYFGNVTLGPLNTTGSVINFTYSGSPAVPINISSTSNLGAAWNGTITIEEPITATDSGAKGYFQILLYNANSSSITFVPSGNTAYAHYNQSSGFNQYDLGYITPRGSVYSSLSSTSASINYAKTVAYADFILSGGSSSATGNTAQVTVAKGDSYDIGNGYKVKVLDVTATATGGAGSAGQVSGVDQLSPSISSADSVTALNTAANPLVYLDSEAAAFAKLIVVGGPMVNTVAASIGGDALTQPGQAVVKAYGDKILVAGYTAADTKDAANALISYLASKRSELTKG
ncbi:MAG: S-layer protein [Candidatus Micrarchaeia archaeon]